MARVGEGTAHGPAIAAQPRGGRGRPLVHLRFHGAPAAAALLPCLFGVAVGRIDGVGRGTPGVARTEVMRDLWQGFGNGPAEGGLPGREHPDEGHPTGPFPLTNPVGHVLLRGRQPAAAQEPRCSETIAQAPQDLVAHVGVPAITGQAHPALRLGNPLEPERSSQRERHEVVRALQERQDRAGGQSETARGQLWLAVGHPAGLGMAQGAKQGDEIEAKRVRGQPQPSFCLGPIRGPQLGTNGGEAVPECEGEAQHRGQGRARARGAERPPTEPCHRSGSGAEAAPASASPWDGDAGGYVPSDVPPCVMTHIVWYITEQTEAEFTTLEKN